jgi:hypothetical protein
MTKLNGKNDVVREAVETQRGRAYIVTLAPHYVTIRLKGQRGSSAYPISYETIYLKAAMIAAERMKREKAAERKAQGLGPGRGAKRPVSRRRLRAGI